jgi:4-carboxymuconolactone decarboxylase
MRFPPLTPKDMTPRQREVAEAIEKRGASGLRGPYVPMVYSPEVADRAQLLGEYLRFNLRLPEPLRALAVLVAAGRHRAADVAPFLATEGIRDSGLADVKVKALAEARRPDGMGEDEAMIHDFCFELSRAGRVKNVTFQKAAGRFGKEICLELVAVCGFTAMQTTMLNITGATEAEA